MPCRVEYQRVDPLARSLHVYVYTALVNEACDVPLYFCHESLYSSSKFSETTISYISNVYANDHTGLKGHKLRSSALRPRNSRVECVADHSLVC